MLNLDKKQRKATQLKTFGSLLKKLRCNKHDICYIYFISFYFIYSLLVGSILCTYFNIVHPGNYEANVSYFGNIPQIYFLGISNV